METRIEHPGAGTLSSSRIIGIDLGTTNSALAWADAGAVTRIFDIPQLVAPGEVSSWPTLPSALYFTDQGQRDSGVVSLPWDPSPAIIAGVFARDEGALVPARLISSAKSWLSNPHVDRTGALLPWGTEPGPRLSAVQASAHLLTHLREAWNHERASGDPAQRLERQQVVLTVPASFDEEARELTVQAACEAGLDGLTLLEEPLAALYAWIAAHRRELTQTFAGGALILVCDVGGGTTDFSLIRVRVEADELGFERVAIGEHLLLGGDNLDLALAVLVERKLAEAAKLSLTQRQMLRRKCTAAKEVLLSDPRTERLAITLLGSGRGVVGGGMTAELTRDEVVRTLTGGFLPVTAPHDVPSRDRRTGLRELGLPYETEPAITRHLAAFLTRAAGAGSEPMVRPDAVLFNGGFFSPAIARTQVLDALTAWSGSRPRLLENARPEAAVALGAAFYGRLRADPVAARRLLIRAGSARSYYIGVKAESAIATAVCVMPRGTDEGTRFDLEREFTVTSNQPAAFTLYSALDRADPINALVQFDGSNAVQAHAPLVTAFRYGKRSKRVPLAVGLSAIFTEIGTLELWCQSRETDHRWRLAFNLRAVEADPLETGAIGDADVERTGVVIEEAAIAEAGRRIRAMFGTPTPALPPEALMGELENTLGHAKAAWPLPVIRRLADTLLDVAAGRSHSPAYEVRWLNLTGFCMRPGFGGALDGWRISELRKHYAAGLAFPREIQNQVEWLVLWQRAGAGFTAGQQRELAQRISGQLGLGQRRSARLNPQIERESWRLLASLERLDAVQRTRLGDDLIERIRREPRSATWLWALSRLGARHPLYGPLNSVVPPAVAGRWVERLLGLKETTADVAAAVAQIGAKQGDSARDIGDELAAAAAARLLAAGFGEAAERVREVVTPTATDAGRVFGESLPEGLALAAGA